MNLQQRIQADVKGTFLNTSADNSFAELISYQAYGAESADSIPAIVDRGESVAVISVMDGETNYKTISVLVAAEDVPTVSVRDTITLTDNSVWRVSAEPHNDCGMLHIVASRQEYEEKTSNKYRKGR